MNSGMNDLPKKLEMQILKIVERNYYRTGNPIGVKIGQLAINESNRKSKTILYTGQSYQLMPYTLRLLKIMDKVGKLERFIGVFSNLGFSRFLFPQEEKRFNLAIKGAVNALKIANVKFRMLSNEPYDGAIFYDLGLDDVVDKIEKKIRTVFENNGVETVITISPHSCYMLKKVYNLDVDVKHIYEVISGKVKSEKKAVIHDPCVLARKLGIVSQVRSVFNAVEPENSGKFTSCCGGPVEVLFPQLSLQIAKSRGNELLKTGVKRIATACPICLMNFLRCNFDANDILSFFGDTNGI